MGRSKKNDYRGVSDNPAKLHLIEALGDWQDDPSGSEDRGVWENVGKNQRLTRRQKIYIVYCGIEFNDSRSLTRLGYAVALGVAAARTTQPLDYDFFEAACSTQQEALRLMWSTNAEKSSAAIRSKFLGRK